MDQRKMEKIKVIKFIRDHVTLLTDSEFIDLDSFNRAEDFYVEVNEEFWKTPMVPWVRMNELLSGRGSIIYRDGLIRLEMKPSCNR